MNMPRFKPGFNFRFDISSDRSLEQALIKSGVQPPSLYRKKDALETIVLGSPILGDKVEVSRVADLILGADYESRLGDLDGQFLIFRFDLKNDKLQVINDRYNGIPFYYSIKNDVLVGSNLYSELAYSMSKENAFDIDGWNFIEFVAFQRLLGQKTYDKSSLFLMPASILCLNKSGKSMRRYWAPTFNFDYSLTRRDAGQRYTELLKASLRRKTSDLIEGESGLFLSGGHDSRSVLAAFPGLPDCFTVGFHDNLEVQCARLCAQAVGSHHHFLPISADVFSSRMEQISWLCGGMFSIDNTLFSGLEDLIPDRIKVLFHGHGLDYLFHGMYLPSKTWNLLGRPTFIKSMQAIQSSVTDYYLNHLPFRTWDVDVEDFVLPEFRSTYIERLKTSIDEILSYGQSSFEDKLGAWEYLMIHAPGRHYSYPNIVSKESLREQRIPCFDNRLFEFYTQLPPQYRLDGSVMRYALNTLSPTMASIPTGNYGIPAGWSPVRKTAALVGRKIAKEVTRSGKFAAPDAKDRTWPDRDTYIRTQPRFAAVMQQAIVSEKLRDAMPYMDWRRVEQKFSDLMEGRSSGGKFLTSLLSLHGFLDLMN